MEIWESLGTDRLLCLRGDVRPVGTRVGGVGFRQRMYESEAIGAITTRWATILPGTISAHLIDQNGGLRSPRFRPSSVEKTPTSFQV
jgi:hypothetical protein